MGTNWEQELRELCKKNAIDYDAFTVDGKDYGIDKQVNQLFEVVKGIAPLICREQKEICLDEATFGFYEIEEGEAELGQSLLSTSSGDIVVVELHNSSIIEAPDVKLEYETK